MIKYLLAIIIVASMSGCAIYDRHTTDKGGYNVDLTPDNNGEDWR